MKKLHFLLFAAFVGFAGSCKTTKSSVSVQEKSETLSQSEERLHSLLLTDTSSLWLKLQADSLHITEFPICSSEQPSAKADGAHNTNQKQKPRLIKMYGLHIDKNIEKKSEQHASLTESNDKSMHSEIHKEANKTKSKTKTPHKFIFILFFIALAAILYKRFAQK